MGEARTRSKRLEKFCKSHSLCCYCGGTSATETIDHVPSIQMFDFRLRPNGFEVPACYECNQSKKQCEQVAAMLARGWPSPNDNNHEEEFRKIVHAVANNNPGLIEEMLATPSHSEWVRGLRLRERFGSSGRIMKVSGPILSEVMSKFGFKLCCALYYETSGQILPCEGGVWVRWYSNVDAVEGKIPAKIFELLGEPRTLKQGKWSVESQFMYSFALSEDNRHGVYFSAFRKSFAVMGFIKANILDFPTSGKPDIIIHQPIAKK